MKRRFFAVAALATLAACSGGQPSTTMPDLAQAGDLAQSMSDLASAFALPGWMLEDVQPLSPRSGQTYGLEAFRGRTLVVTILQGF